MADVILETRIPDAVVTKALEQYLVAKHIPQIQDPEFPDDPSKTIDEFGKKRWVEIEIHAHLHRICGIGKRILRAEPADTGLFV
jgi:hypothetical protein